jgi:DnaJ-class molecular chaperone
MDVSFIESIDGVSKEVEYQKKTLCFHCEGKKSEPGT